MGRSFTLRGCGFFHVANGKIRFQRGYWDKATWFGQLGIPLEPVPSHERMKTTTATCSNQPSPQQEAVVLRRAPDGKLLIAIENPWADVLPDERPA